MPEVVAVGIETTDADEVRPGEMVGTAVQRREDRRLLTGDARYTDDIQQPRTGYLALLGSQYAHAGIESIDASDAEAMDDVLAVYTYDDLDALAALADRLTDREVAVSPVDHGISKALYFEDPAGNDLEAYVDTRDAPDDRWAGTNRPFRLSDAAP